MDVRNRIKDWIQESIRVKQAIHDDPKIRKQIETAAAVITGIIQANGTVFACGNGGSASDSAHFVGELLNRFTRKREYSLPAMDLSAQNAAITAIANDYSYDQIFAKQLKALGQQDDVLLAISTSGNSTNVIKAMQAAKSKGLKSIGMTGRGGKLLQCADLVFCADSDDTPRIQEAHITVGHILCELVDRKLYPKAFEGDS